MKKKLASLIDVKSLLTLGLGATFITLSLMGVVPIANFMEVFLMIITFYFSRNTKKQEEEES